MMALLLSHLERLGLGLVFVLTFTVNRGHVLADHRMAPLLIQVVKAMNNLGDVKYQR